jgi:hypothetical protein
MTWRLPVLIVDGFDGMDYAPLPQHASTHRAPNFCVVNVLVFLFLRYAMVLNESPVDGGVGVDPWPALV